MGSGSGPFDMNFMAAVLIRFFSEYESTASCGDNRLWRKIRAGCTNELFLEFFVKFVINAAQPWDIQSGVDLQQVGVTYILAKSI